MNNETFIDLCFIRSVTGNFFEEINEMFTTLFAGIRLNWYLEEKSVEGGEMVLAEIKGMSPWSSEAESLQFLEKNASKAFWQNLQGYKMFIYPVTMRGCSSCGTN